MVTRSIIKYNILYLIPIIGGRVPNRSWMTQNAMRIKLRRLGLESPASLATLILETFLENSGVITSRTYYKSEFNREGKKYQEWIETLVKNEILEYYKKEDITKKGDDWIRYKPGKLIRPYINKEKEYQEELASMRDVMDSENRMDKKKADRSELQELKSKMNEIAEAVKKLQIASAPPDDPQKEADRKEATETLGRLAVVN